MLEAQGYEVAAPGSEVIDMDDVETQEMDPIDDPCLQKQLPVVELAYFWRKKKEECQCAEQQKSVCQHALQPTCSMFWCRPCRIPKLWKMNKTRKQTNSTIQPVIEHSNVFESRSMWHPAKVGRESFEKEFSRVSRKRQKLIVLQRICPQAALKVYRDCR